MKKGITQIKCIEEMHEASAEVRTFSTAIKLKCLDCSNYEWNEVRDCYVKKCPLYPFRMGKNPYRNKRELTDEQREQLSERMKNIKNNK